MKNTTKLVGTVELIVYVKKSDKLDEIKKKFPVTISEVETNNDKEVLRVQVDMIRHGYDFKIGMSYTTNETHDDIQERLVEYGFNWDDVINYEIEHYQKYSREIDESLTLKDNLTEKGKALVMLCEQDELTLMKSRLERLRANLEDERDSIKEIQDTEYEVTYTESFENFLYNASEMIDEIDRCINDIALITNYRITNPSKQC